MSDNREIAYANTDREIWRSSDDYLTRDTVSVTEGGGIAIQSGGTVVVKTPRAWIDAATERGRMQGWSADEATVERVARVWARHHGGDPMRANDPKYDPEDGWPDFIEETRAALAAIPVPPALIECPRCRTLRSADHHAWHVCD